MFFCAFCDIFLGNIFVGNLHVTVYRISVRWWQRRTESLVEYLRSNFFEKVVKDFSNKTPSYMLD